MKRPILLFMAAAVAGMLAVSCGMDDKLEALNQQLEDMRQELDKVNNDPGILGEIYENSSEALDTCVEYPGGETQLLDYIKEKFNFPQKAQDDQLRGIAIARVLINKGGKVIETKIEKSLSPEYDEEIFRLCRNMETFTPAMKDGKPVSVYYHIPFDFPLPIDGTIYMQNEVDTAPSYPGGYPQLEKHLSENLIYPFKAKQIELQGKVLMKLTIDKNGRPCHPQVVRSLSPECDLEAIRIFATLENFSPAIKNGQPVPCCLNIPVKFAL